MDFACKGFHRLLKNSALFLLLTAQRFTAAISILFSVLALAAEGDCSAHKEFFQQTV
jgi:hypothetical protein